MPISIKNQIDCTGCGACSNICPKDCIEMKSDKTGFKYPFVSKEKCIGCDLCVKVCPMMKSTSANQKYPVVYAAWSKNPDIRYKSTSGGAFSEFAYAILEMGGVVSGAAYDSNNMVEHIIVEDIEEIEKIRQSKYTQSDIGYVYREIKNRLERNVVVLFCGAPCQVAALKSFLVKEYSNLYTIDFICRGMNSPKAYRFWLDELETKYKSKINKVWFKYKEYGWKKSPFCTRIDLENGDQHIISGNDNHFMIGYLRGNFYLRPSCSECHFKGINRVSDITVADFWKIPEELDDDLGTSMIMLNTNKGEQLFAKIKNNLNAYKREPNEIIKGNECFKESAKLNPKGTELLERLGEKPFSMLIKEYTKEPLAKRVYKRIKKIGKVVLMRKNM